MADVDTPEEVAKQFNDVYRILRAQNLALVKSAGKQPKKQYGKAAGLILLFILLACSIAQGAIPWRWDIGGTDTWDNFMRIFFMNKKQKEILEKIISDKTSGSSEILTNLNKFLLSNAKEKKLITESISAVSTKLSHFAIIENYINELNILLTSANYEQLTEYLRNFEDDEKLIIKKIFTKYL